MNYKIIDKKNWCRSREYTYFTKINPSIFSVTAMTDITALYHYCKENGIKVFPTILYAIAIVVNGIPQFRYGYEKHELVEYEELEPSFISFDADTSSCNVLQLPMSSFDVFYSNYLKLINKEITFIPKRNTFTVSSEPRIHFTSFSFSLPVNIDEPSLCPSIMLGKFKEENGRIIMPFSLTINHIAADGYHASLLFDRFQKIAEVPEQLVEK